MLTHDRIQLLAQACAQPCVEKLMGKISETNLSDWVKAELGHLDALDQFHSHGPLQSKAIPPLNILHIVSGNTPHSALQSIIRGIVLGSTNTIKLPSNGLPELLECLQGFPEQLKALIETYKKLTDDHWKQANVVVAIGSDASISAIHEQISPNQIFIPHGHKVSIGIVYNDFENAAPLAARDISLYNQQGCLSPHAIYVQGDSQQFASLLADAMAKYAEKNKPQPISISEAGSIRNLRETTRFLSANDSATQLWESPNNLDWTVIHDPTPELKLSCLNCCVYVKPLPEQLDEITLGTESQHLSTIAIHPFHQNSAQSLAHLPAHRICPLGQSQQPSLFWHHDGFAPLASLVQWKDIG